MANDLHDWRRRLQVLVEAGGWRRTTLGAPLGEPLELLQRNAAHADAPRLLIATALHGNEIAGPWGLLAFLRDADEALLDRAHLALLPMVNATGFAADTRLNSLGENPNRGYGPHAGEHAPSAEGRVLLAHEALLIAASRDGALACHEDLTRSFCYVYAFEPGAAPGPFSRALVAAGARHFRVHPDGVVDGQAVHDGVVLNHHDGSLESWLSAQGAAVAACVETPGRADLAQRVAAQAGWMRTFVELRCRSGPDPLQATGG
ncbi:MAG: M14 family metallocarboxypeptidase [Rubrivivax sp.]|nr:M14 family metallocarboxypeptidase [Rubrivivax sp.]